MGSLELLLSFATKRREDLLRVHVSEFRIEFLVRNGTIIGKKDVMIDTPGGLEIQDCKTSDEGIVQNAAKKSDTHLSSTDSSDPKTTIFP